MIEYLIPATLIGIFAFIAFRLAFLRWRSTAARLGLVIVGLALSAPALLFASNYVFPIPYATYLCELRALPGLEISSGLIGSLLGVLFASSKLRRRRINLPVLSAGTSLALALLIAPFAKQLLHGMDYSELENKWKDGICLQTSSCTCVPACAATLVSMQGGHITEAELARACGCTRSGTEVWYMMRALRHLGYKADYSYVRSVKEAPVPSIVGVRLGDIGHVVVLLARDEDGLTIGEPLRGLHRYAWSIFHKCYSPSGTCITIKRIRQN